MTQQQFLNVIDCDEARRKFRDAIDLRPLDVEEVPLDAALGRVLAGDCVAAVDVPSFDRSNYDGYAVRAEDTYRAREEDPRRLQVLDEVLSTGIVPQDELTPGAAMAIATGGMLPRGADAVVMVEHTEVERAQGDRTPFSGGAPPRAMLLVTRPATPGFGVSFAGTDIAAGETVLWRGQVISSRESGVLAAIGVHTVSVWRRPLVAIISTGNEIIETGQPMQPGLVYDSNARILADAVRELGAEPKLLGIVRDDLAELRAKLHEALAAADVVLLSGGTSKGAGDLSYRAVSELSRPGIVAHGVALKPGKPICLAAEGGKPVVVLPGFPTSAVFTFHEFVAPVIRILGGRPPLARSAVDARLAVKVNSQIGRTEYLLVALVPEGTGADQLAAYPMGKGSGSVTAFSRADGFVTIDRHREIVEADAAVEVRLLAKGLRPADLVVIGSHCVGLDFLLGQMQLRGFTTKFLAVGSTGGLQAAGRGHCDLAGMHLLDPATGEYNLPLLPADVELIEGYGRLQGIVFRRDDERFSNIKNIKRGQDPFSPFIDVLQCVMVNRNAGSGTRILIDRLLDGRRPAGYAVQPTSHNAVAASVAQGRSDWGVAVEWVAKRAGLGFLSLEEERYDFAVPKSRLDRPAVIAFKELLSESGIRAELARMGFSVESRFQ